MSAEQRGSRDPSKKTKGDDSGMADDWSDEMRCCLEGGKERDHLL